MYKLYNYQSSGNCYKIRLLMAQLGIAFESVQIDILARQSRTEEFLKINPNGRVPVLQIDDKYLPESNAAIWYLAEGSQYLPEDRFERAQVLQWMFFEQYSHEPYIATVRFWISILKDKEGKLEQIKTRMPLGYAALDVMEQHLSKNDFFVGNRYSIADIALYAYTHVADEGEFDLSGYKNIHRWMQRIESQPGYVSIKESPKDGIKGVKESRGGPKEASHDGADDY
ncbi:MAG TPA: glutathione S-transferase family protein [Cellvibrionaceae bacterium]